MAKRPKDAVRRDDRRFRVEEMKRAKKAAERRKNVIIAGVCVAVAGGLIAIPVVGIAMEGEEGSSLGGASILEAACDPPIVEEAEGVADHVGADVRVDYKTVPPSSGRHFQQAATISRRGFYTPEDTPTVEQLVHNLEHGYTIAWYDPNLPGGEKDTLQDLAEELRSENRTRKFIAAPWDLARGAFPAGKPVALSHWGAEKKGYRQFCGKVSGAAIAAFIDQYPASDSPEPNTP